MEEKINNAVDEDNDVGRDGKKRISYVSKGLKSMIDFVAGVYNQLGHTAFHSNKAIAAVHGFSPDSIKQQLTSSQQYRLLELKHGTGYRVTPRFQRVYLPKSEAEKRAAVIECLKSPETYEQLFKDYEYHVVPLDGVKNHFIRSFGFKEAIALKAAHVFLENLKDFNLLDSRSVLTSAITFKSAELDSKIDGDESKNENGTPPENSIQHHDSPARTPSQKVIFQTEIEAAGKKTIPIYLTGNNQAILVYPDDITENDVELIKHQIEGVLLRIKFDAQKK